MLFDIGLVNGNFFFKKKFPFTKPMSKLPLHEPLIQEKIL